MSRAPVQCRRSEHAYRGRAAASVARRAGWLPALLLALLGVEVARADCFGDITGKEAAFNAQLNRDPAAAIEDLRARIATAGTGEKSTPSLAELYAMLMNAYERTNELDQARNAGALGLKALTTTDPDELQRRLTLGRISLLDEQGQISEAVRQYDAATVGVTADAPDFLCILNDRGYLHMRAGRQADAARELLQAYRLAENSHRDLQRADIGSVLAEVYNKYDLFDEALALENDSLRTLSRSGDTDKIATAHLIRGDALMHRDSPDDALAEYRLAESLYLQEKNRDDAVGAARRICAAVAADRNRSAEATALCSATIRDAQAIGDNEHAKLAQASLAQAELYAGRPQEALRDINLVLEDGRTELTGVQRHTILAVRAEAERALGDAAGALRDMTDYATWLKADMIARQPAQVALLRAKFDMERKDQAARQAAAEAAASRAVAARAALIRNLVIALAAAFLAIALAVVWVVRRRRELIREREVEHERVTALGRLAAGIAHEFNNALTVVQQAVGLLAVRPSVATDGTAMELVRSIEQISHTSAVTTAQLQSFGMQQNLRSRAVPLKRLLEELRPQLLKAIGGEVSIDLQVGDPAPCSWVDERQLSNALFCLVMNAADAMRRQGTVTIRSRTDSDAFARIEVADTGVGMTPEVLAHAAEPFFTTKPVGEGSGLGLSMVDGFVKQSGGSMSITSVRNQGTTVALRLPPVPKGAMGVAAVAV
jgi:signal transduction histidine kinase